MKDKTKKLTLILLAAIIVVAAAVSAVVVILAENKPEPVKVSSIEVKSYLDKRYYLPDEELIFDGCLLTIRYSDGKSEDVTLADERLTVLTTGTAVDEKVGFIKVSLDGATANIPYMVSTKYEGVTFKEETLGTVYSVGNGIYYGSSKFELKRRGSDSTATVMMSAASNNKGYNFSTEGFSTEIAGDYKMKITFLAEVYEVNYKVVGYPFVKSVTLAGTPRSVYLKGESLDVGDLRMVTITSMGESAEVLVTADMFSGFDSSEVGENKQMKLCYKPQLSDYDKVFEIIFNYTVYDENQIDEVVFVAETGELNYMVGEEIKLSESKLRIKFAGGVSTEVSVKNPSVKIDESMFDTSKGGRFALKMTYTTPNGNVFECETEYIVTARVVKMEIINVESIKGFKYAEDNAEDKTKGKTIVLEYRLNDTFDFGDCCVLITYDDGTSGQFNLQEQLESEERIIILLSMPDRKRLTVSSFDMTIQRENRIYVGWAGGALAEIIYVVTA